MDMNKIATRSPFWQNMAPELELIADLSGGTPRMRAAGLRWLPREEAESWSAWRARLNRSILFNGFTRTLQALSGKPFSAPVQLEEAEPPLLDLAQNMDSCGMSLTEFARQLMTALLSDGIAHIQIDSAPAGGTPYFILRKASQLIGARQDDAHALTEIRLSEIHTRPKTRFEDEMIESIRLITKHDWQLWQPKGANAQWQLSQHGTHDFGAVPLISLCVAPTGFMSARPPLADLAWLNLAHWQSSSDQRHILHVARVPILFGRALQLNHNDIEIGPNRLILADDPASDLKFVEHSGAAIEAGRQDLSDLEEKMALLGLDMLTRQLGPVTATARRLDLAQNHAALVGIVSACEEGLRRAFHAAARWMGVTTKARLHIDRTWHNQDASIDLARWLLDARQSGEISQDEFLQQARHKGLLGS